VNPLTSHDGERVVLEAVASGRLDADLAHAFGDRLEDPDFRRVVMDYVETSGLYGTGAALKSPTYRSFLKKRTGSEKMIYTDYIKVEHEVMAQMLYDVQLANTIKSIDDNYNEIDQFKERAVRMNYDNVIKALQAYAAAMEVPEGKKRPTGVDLYRQLGTKMAIGFDNLGRLAAADELPIGDKGEYAELVNALGENWLENADIKKEMGKDWTADDRIPLKEPYANQILGLANYILKQKEIPVGKKAAATIFKGIAERKRAVKDILGSKFMTWERLVKEHPDYTTWQPERGNIFFNVHTIPEQIAEDLMSGQFESIGISKDKIKKMLAMGGRKRQLVIHNDIAKTLDNITPRRNENWEHHRKVIKLWKMWQLGMPRRTFKYNFRNLTGDTDAVFAGNPGSIKKVKTATIQLIHLAMLRSPTYNRLAENTRTRMEEIFGKPELTDELNEWVKRGGYGTLLQAQELDHFSDVMKFGEELIRKADVKSVKDIPKKVWKGYWKAIRRATDTREAILRYASYLDYLEQMQADPNGMPKNFGGSNSEEIKGLADIRTRAFWLSNELLGAYDRVGVVGQAVREHLIPFWSWKEVNFIRYKRLLQNAIQDHGLMEGIGRRVAGTAIRSPFVAARVGIFALKATFLLNALTIWNLGIMGGNDEDLPEEVRNRPHLTLWRDSEGEVQYFSRLGALGGLLEWVALDTAFADLKDLIGGRKTIKEKAVEMAWAAPNVIIQGGQPFLKIGAELISRQAMFPDVSKPRVIRDRILHVARSLGVENEYNLFVDSFIRPVPGKGYTASAKKAFWYEADAFEAAYYDTFANKRRFMKKIGKYAEGFWLSPKGSSLYNARTALRYQDEEAMLYYMQQYFERGGTKKGLQQSLENLNPLAGMNKKDQVAFTAQLTPEDLDKLIKALVFYRQLRTGVAATHIWKPIKEVLESPIRTRPKGIGTLGEIARIKPLTKKPLTKKEAKGGK